MRPILTMQVWQCSLISIGNVFWRIFRKYLISLNLICLGRGLFFSHFGWLMIKERTEVDEKRKTIDMSDCIADPFVMIQKQYVRWQFAIQNSLFFWFLTFSIRSIDTIGSLCHWFRLFCQHGSCAIISVKRLALLGMLDTYYDICTHYTTLF